MATHEEQLERIDGRLRDLYPADCLQVVAIAEAQGREPPGSWSGSQGIERTTAEGGREMETVRRVVFYALHRRQGASGRQLSLRSWLSDTQR